MTASADNRHKLRKTKSPGPTAGADGRGGGPVTDRGAVAELMKQPVVPVG